MYLSNNLEDFLKEERVLRLASIASKGKSHLVPLCYVYSNNRIWIHAEGKRKRHQNFRKNPNVTILIDKYFDENWKKNQAVLIEGKVKFHAAKTQNAYEAQKLLQKKYPQYKTRWENEQVAMIEIEPINLKQWRIDPETSLY